MSQAGVCGQVRRVNFERGYGFIRPDGAASDVFFHCKDMLPALPFDETLNERRVKFDLYDDHVKGKTAAKNVRPA